MSCDLSDSPISPVQAERLCRAAAFFAAGAARGLDLPEDERNDLRQDIVLQVLLRLRHFDPSRGPFGAFADLTARHAAQRLKRRAVRERGTVLPAGVLENAKVTNPWSEPGSGTACSAADLGRDLGRALVQAPPRVAETFAAFAAGTADRPPMPRTTWHRRCRALRLWLLAHGVGPPR